MIRLKKGVVVWRESRMPVRPHHEAWHARAHGCRLTVGVFGDGSVLGVIERARARDGRVDTVAHKDWGSRRADPSAVVLEARNWCEARALEVSA